ncbi:MAG: DUF3370 family protein, partial [Synechococcaceae cyanobacterium]|nr:DUF3370 family protein [Synechococcaceae cyanobacterium]
EITIPARGRIVLFRTQLPALGIANALLKGKSDGPFQMAVVAARNPTSDADILAVLDGGRLAPGRTYLGRLQEIRNRTVFSRVAGVALGDRYEADLSHDLQAAGPLHVPLTSTQRTHFGTRDVQVNGLASRMADSALDNVGTYGVRFDVDLHLRGSGPHELVLSHPTAPGERGPFTAFRGSLQVLLPEGLREMHVGLPSGRSVSLAQLNLRPGVSTPVRVSLVYPADATPGHLLSVVPSAQLARLREEEERQRELARREAEKARPPQQPARPQPARPAPAAPAQPAPARTAPAQAAPPRVVPDRPAPAAAGSSPPPPAPPPPPPPAPAVTDMPPPPPAAPEGPPPPDPFAPLRPPAAQYEWRPDPVVPPGAVAPPAEGDTLLDRYRRAVEAQRRLIEGLQTR